MCQGNNHSWICVGELPIGTYCDCGQTTWLGTTYKNPQPLFELSPSQLDYLAKKIVEGLKPSVNQDLKQEMLNCPLCNTGSYDGSEEYWSSWKIKHKFHI